MNVYTHTVLGDLATDVGKLPALPASKATESEAVALANTGTDGPLRPDDDSRRRTRRRIFSDPSCENTANDGENWRNGAVNNSGDTTAETTGNHREMTTFVAPRLTLTTAEGGSRTHTPTEGLRILNPARLPIPPLRRLLHSVYTLAGKSQGVNQKLGE